MAKQTINIGASPNDGTGTPLRTAFDYCNLNFTELYTATGPSGNNIVCPGSATITGDLTVDTSTLKVDSANNRVGIGTASPTAKLQLAITGSASAITRVNSFGNDGTFGFPSLSANSTGAFFGMGVDQNSPSAGFGFFREATGWNTALAFYTNGQTGGPNIDTITERYRIDSSGVATWSNVGGVAGTAMTLNSTGLGVGASPSYQLHVAKSQASQTTIYVDNQQNNAAASSALSLSAYGGTWNLSVPQSATFVNPLIFKFGSTEMMRLDASGNLLVGTTSGTARLDVRTSASQRVINAISTAAADSSTYGVYIAKFANDSTTAQRFVGFTINNDGAGSGQINANGASQAAFGSFSDSRLKENILSLPSQLANILSLRPVEFDYKDGSGHQIGFIAQEMREVYSDTVSEQDGFLTVTGWSKTEARLVSAIKELAAKVQALEAKLA